jgi:carbohydrate-selective porin OprB
MLKAGMLYADADFNVLQNAADFLNSSYGLVPTVPMPTYPDPKAGALLSLVLSPRVTVSAGVFEAAPLQAVDGPSFSSGAFTIAETNFHPFSQDASFHGSYRVGTWQQAKGAWLDSSRRMSGRNYGVYATGDHWFRKVSPSGENSGVGVFFQLGWSPAERNEISSYWGAGMSYAGFLPQRHGDGIGVGLTQARLSGGGAETVLETFYKIQITKRMCLQPDLQWVHHVAGEQRNALLGGFRFGVTF